MTFQTADLCDENLDLARVAEPLFRSYGAKSRFYGQIHTVKVHEDNVLVKEVLATQVDRGVLVVDGGGSLRCALVGDILARMGADNGWQGILVYGCIRDSAVIAGIDIGIKALNTLPLKSVKRGWGERNGVVNFAGVQFVPGEYLYSDEDGIIVAEKALL